MIRALALILACQLAGEAGSRALSLPVPGPVLGMALLWGLMSAAPPIAALVRPVGEGILRHLSLLGTSIFWLAQWQGAGSAA